MSLPMPPTSRLILLITIFGFAFLLEQYFPLRKTTQPKTQRLFINLGLATISALLLRLSFYPIVLFVAQWTTANEIGLLPGIGISGTAALLVSIVLLDGTLFHWHWMLHKIPFLWRFHNVHHMDLDLDSSTAFRFHFGELILSTAFRSAQIVVFGISPFALALFEILITSFAQFHHSNIRLPLIIERLLSRLIITPRLHGIHHSIVQRETDSNFGTIFSWWDYLHRTRIDNVPQTEIVIGVPSYRDPREQTLWKILWIPFRQRKTFN
jgi:sterol desaturase/sphingolipid hydroxylase (fatty acid hydroxylase superfamily)